MKKLSKLLLALTFAFSITSSAFAVVVASWGGAYTESQKLGYGDPSAKKLGIPIDWVDYSGGLSEVKAQQAAGAVTWDIMDVYAMDTIIGCDEGLFMDFDHELTFLHLVLGVIFQFLFFWFHLQINQYLNIHHLQLDAYID